MMAALVQAAPFLFVFGVAILFNMPSNKDMPGRWWDA